MLTSDNINRRDALKKFGLTMGAGFIAPHMFSGNFAESPSFKKISDRFEHPSIKKPTTAITLGAGARGTVYGRYALEFPEEIKIVGVAEPIPFRNDRYAKWHNIDDANRFDTWEEVFKRPKFADAVIISTPDHLHYGPCMQALEMGYDILLEKPIAQTMQECIDIEQLALETKRIVAVCHVLRYAPYFIKMRDIVQSGTIGDVVSVQHLEAIEHIHMSHSFVRGNWHSSKESTPIILAKSCHDLDILHWITGKPCTRIFAMGDLRYFTKENKPPGAAKRCLDCPVENECIYSAKRIYLTNRTWLYVMDLPADENLHEAFITNELKTTNYGRCVYDMENDQPDHYVTSIEFDGDITAAFSMEALTSYGSRHTRIMGTRGDIVGDMRTMRVTDFLSRETTVWDAREIAELEEYRHAGHGGGDWRLMRDFVQAVSRQDSSLLVSSIFESMESHSMAFKAEESRMSGKAEKL